MCLHTWIFICHLCIEIIGSALVCASGDAVSIHVWRKRKKPCLCICSELSIIAALMLSLLRLLQHGWAITMYMCGRCRNPVFPVARKILPDFASASYGWGTLPLFWELRIWCLGAWGLQLRYENQAMSVYSLKLLSGFIRAAVFRAQRVGYFRVQGLAWRI